MDAEASSPKPMGAFRIFSDRSASDLEAFEWNPTMDLLACLTAPPDSTMSIYRLLSEDQSPKLLSEKITGTGSALAWSPCGRRLAVGDRLGGIAIYDGETGGVLHSRRSHAVAVTAFCWVESGSACEDPAWTQVLPPLLSVPSAPSNMFAEPREEAPTSAAGLTFLASVDEGGHVVIAAGGTFPVQVQDLPSLRPRAVQLSRDCRCLAVLGHPEPLDSGGSIGSSGSAGSQGIGESEVKASKASDLALLVLDVRKLAIRRRELAQSASLVERLSAVATYTQQAVDTLANVWRSAASTFVNKMRAFFDCLQAYSGDDTDVHSELLFTLCTGNPSDALHAFLTRQTTPQQLSRIEKGLMQALDYVDLVTCTRLQVAVQHLLAILQDLKACSGRQRFQSIGLDSELLCELETQTLRFSSLTEHLLLDCSKARSFARTLFQLLLFQAQKLTENTDATPSTRPESRSGACVALGTDEDVESFVAAMRSRRSLELEEVSQRIGKSAKGSENQESLVTQLMTLSSTAEGLGEQLCAAMARCSRVMAERHLQMAPPWQSLKRPEGSETLQSPRGLGRPVVHMVWEEREGDSQLVETLPARLRLLWCDGTEAGAQLCLARLDFPSSELAMAKLSAGSFGHFLLCRSYDAERVAVLLQDTKRVTTQVCLMNLEAIPFTSGLPVPATDFTELAQDAVKQSEPLPESYFLASAMRVMSQRGVCSVYSSRARRLLTLDMEADEDDMEDDP
ncbi:APC4 [Symbiodinium sp. CCMP2456]|nr:APC4 [Symbiodinium sp. CCMP2456]